MEKKFEKENYLMESLLEARKSSNFKVNFFSVYLVKSLILLLS